MMIDDHHIRGHGFSACRIHMTFAPKTDRVEPKQLSRLEVIKGIKADRSSRLGTSAKSPVRVVLAQACTWAKGFHGLLDQGNVAACCANCSNAVDTDSCPAP
jgi:hypothetical protein